jgi:hypothetical protein
MCTVDSEIKSCKVINQTGAMRFNGRNGFMIKSKVPSAGKSNSLN